MKFHILGSVSLFYLFSTLAFAQVENEPPKDFTYDEKPLIRLDDAETEGERGRGLIPTDLFSKAKDVKKEAQKLQKKASKKNHFHDVNIKAKKVYRKYNRGSAEIVEKFYFLPEPIKPDPNVDLYYYYNLDKGSIEQSHKFKKDDNLLLMHGPYVKKVNGEIEETADYYAGTKHGRWEKYRRGVLYYKESFSKGFPIATERTYYDKDKKKLKEIIPIRNGFKDGYYSLFHPNGKIAERGYYQCGEKVGRWYEYYDNGYRKREIQHQKEAFEGVKPFVFREWGQNGAITKDNSR
ncbi:MAG: hypothetical protein JJT94_16270 [Bernardetiaceae bacterium]|nr:hypothetical protein [Bernardetiaceae bacterium]